MPTFASGIDLEAEPLAELADPLAGLLPVEEDRVGHRLLAEQDVLGDGQDGDQHEVLVDHADAAGDGVRRARRSVTGVAVEQDLALVRAGQPVEDVHQGGLAGAVLAEQGVDLAGPDVEVDVVVGDDARIALGDAAHLEGGCVNDFGPGSVIGSSRSALRLMRDCGRAGRPRCSRPARDVTRWTVRSLATGSAAALGGAGLERAGLHRRHRGVELALDVGGDQCCAMSWTARRRCPRSSRRTGCRLPACCAGGELPGSRPGRRSGGASRRW